MNLLAQAFTELWSEKRMEFIPVVKYSAKWKGYRASIRRQGHIITASLSKQWQDVSADIQIGLIEELLLRLFHEKRQTAQTINMDLYANFIRGIHVAIPKTKTHPLLAESFARVNRFFFANALEEPNFALSQGMRVLGKYEYGTDTISITESLLDRQELLDYVMYHEMLHKHHKFITKKGRQRHHSVSFRKDEKSYPNAELLEKELGRFIGKKRWFNNIF